MGEQDLAVALLRLAVIDLERDGRIKERAQRFLESRDFEFWASVAGVTPEAIRTRVRTKPLTDRLSV